MSDRIAEPIEIWLTQFKKAWQDKNIDSVADLFTDDVEYWETPFRKLEDKAQLKSEWQAINDQTNIELDLEDSVSANSEFVVKWSLKYSANGELQEWSGLYLIKFDGNGLCNYFYQVGERK